MKLTKKIMFGMLLLFMCSITVSAVMFKKIHDQNDKGELYFIYGTILEQPFSHLVVNGGNVSNIIYEPAEKASVRVYKRWNGYKENRIKAFVSNDTLYLEFPGKYNDIYEKNQLKYTPMVRLFSPQLKSVTGTNTGVQLLKFQQRNLAVNISGSSKFEVESLIYNFDKVSIKATDSSDVVFEVSPSRKKSPETPGVKTMMNEIPETVKGWDAFNIHSLDAFVSGHSFIDVGHAQIDSLKMQVGDSSAIILSGGTIKKNIVIRK